MFTELELLERGGGTFAPKLFWSQPTLKVAAIIFEECGPDVDIIFNKLGKNFSAVTIAYFALNAIENLQQLHALGYVHTRLRPTKFLIGPESKPNRIYLCGLKDCKKVGYCKISKSSIKNHDSYKHLFFSVNQLKNKPAHPLDDLESLAYILIYFLRREPYLGTTGIAKCNEKKPTASLTELCLGLPVEIKKFFEKVRAFSELKTINYDLLKEPFKDYLRKCLLTPSLDKAAYDWIGQDGSLKNLDSEIMICDFDAMKKPATKKLTPVKKTIPALTMICEETESALGDGEESTRSHRVNFSSDPNSTTPRLNLATPRLGVSGQPCFRISKAGRTSEGFSPSSLRKRDIDDDGDECSVADKVTMLKNSTNSIKKKMS